MTKINFPKKPQEDQSVELPQPGSAWKLVRKSNIYMAYVYDERSGHQLNLISELIHSKK